jgi:AraC-like DNA-binding protein
MTRHARPVARSRDPLEPLEVTVRVGPPRHRRPCVSERTSLVLVRRGALALQSDGVEHVADPCTAVLLWERAPPAHGEDHLVIELGPRLAAERRRGLGRRRDAALPLSPRLQLAVAELAATLRWQPEPVVARAALELVDELLEAARPRGRVPRAAGQPRRLALAAIMALHRDLSINRSIEELAEELGCSPYHLMHAFRAEIGETMRVYRLRARLGVALHRLADGHDDLTTLAIELGFASHSHFTEAFTRELGLSPSRLRARLQGRARPAPGGRSVDH